YCDKLTEIKVDARNTSYTSIGGVLFDKPETALVQYPAGKQDNTYTIPYKVKKIVNEAFFNCKRLTGITLPASVISIGNRAFFGCDGLTSITFPASVTFIGYQAFYNSKGLTSITIPPSVTEIRFSAFYNCSNLKTVTLSQKTQVGSDAFPPSAQLIYKD
ncbi:MAG: leucine-rich repeat domain-containing protein, partial [Treponema sp.]|nr:leucine-rich repeat domain-containing protein [Treponema sp.]